MAGGGGGTQPRAKRRTKCRARSVFDRGHASFILDFYHTSLVSRRVERGHTGRKRRKSGSRWGEDLGVPSWARLADGELMTTILGEFRAWTPKSGWPASAGFLGNANGQPAHVFHSAWAVLLASRLAVDRRTPSAGGHPSSHLGQSSPTRCGGPASVLPAKGKYWAEKSREDGQPTGRSFIVRGKGVSGLVEQSQADQGLKSLVGELLFNCITGDEPAV